MTTIAEHIAEAESDLDALRQYAPDEAAYRGLALTAIAHALAAIGLTLDGQEKAAQAIPGLPEGYQLTTEQSAGNDRKWRYVLISRDGIAWVSRYKWDSSDTAFVGGLRAARQHDETGTEPRP